MLRVLMFIPWLFLVAFSLTLREDPISPIMADQLLLAGKFYRVVLPALESDLTKIIESAKHAGFSVRIAQGTTVTYFLGTQPCSDCTPENERERLPFPHLFVDGALLWLRAGGLLSKYNLRPAQSGSYELIVAPTSTASASAILDEIGQRLFQLGVVANPLLPLSLEELTVVPGVKPPKPPDGVRLDSVLYALMLMPDWYEFAPQNKLELWGLRVRVIVELVSPEAQLAPTHNIIIEARSPSGLLRVLVPIHQLVLLASDPAVKIVRPPFQPGL
uniref:Uncharacterized protein n=2 Tax=Candidatus Bipolaricaulota TaxID=67810 RepID=H5SJT8_9BACT|nr:hypothetical protein HGMM_F37H05C17 [uncultured Acetothermia bacterium]BAL59506.1 hypothetical protein HGMM_OP4C142 [Candidatus Acetothermum autotrophicum]